MAKIALILGLGKSGIMVSKLALHQGYLVYALDENKQLNLPKNLNNKNFKFCTSYKNFNFSPDIIIISPGIPSKSKLVQITKEFDCPTISEIEFAHTFSKRTIIAITGTNGKSTVVDMLIFLLKQINKKAYAIGNNITTYSQFILESNANEIGILELSSFQLEKTSNLKPQLAILTNLASDHQDRYDSFQDYVNIKLKLFTQLASSKILLFQPTKSFINKDKLLKADSYGENQESSFFLDKTKLIFKNKIITDFKNIKLIGQHNYLNATAAIAALIKLKFSLPQQPLKGFTVAEHKQEIINQKPLVINDSKSTNPHSLLIALKNFSKQIKKIHLIVGGKDKKMDFSIVNILLCKYVKKVYLYGELKKKLHHQWSKIVICEQFDDFEIMIKHAWNELDKKDILLFSPAGSSQDLFKDYQQRGNLFKKIIRETIKKEK